MSSDGAEREDLVEKEGVNAGGPVSVGGPEPADVGSGHGSEPDPASAPGDNGELLSGAGAATPTRRPPQPGQQLEAGEG